MLVCVCVCVCVCRGWGQYFVWPALLVNIKTGGALVSYPRPRWCKISSNRIRATRRDSHRPREETLGSTLGEEATGYVTVDPDSGRVMRYDEMSVMSQIVAAPASTVDLLVKEGQSKWKQVGTVNTEDDGDLDAQWKNDLQHGTNHLKNSFVRQGAD